MGTLKGNQTVTITAKNGSWYKISSPLVGYVHSDYISITNTSNGDQAFNATGKVINVTSTLNVRNQPSTSGTVVGTLKSDQTVTITAKNGSWYKISSPLVGYVHSDYISMVNNVDNEIIKQKAINKIKEFLKNVFSIDNIGTNFELSKSSEYYIGNCILTLTAGLEPFIHEDAALKFNIANGEIDDSTEIGNIIKNGFNVVGMFSDKLENFLTTFTKEIDNTEIELDINILDLSVDLNFTLNLKDEDLDSGVNLYFKINLELNTSQLAYELIENVKKFVDLLKDKVPTIILGTIVCLLIGVIVFTPADEILVGLLTATSFIINATQDAINNIIDLIFNKGIIVLRTR